MLKTVAKWTLNKFMPYGPLGLFVLAFCESSFFPVPPDILLIALAVMHPDKSFLLAAITTAGSVTGAMLGYLIGLKGGRPVLGRFVSEEKIASIHNYFEKYDAWAIGIAGFTPIPYKVFTIAAGVFYINFTRFILISVLSRGGRFFLVGTFLYFFGARAKAFISEYFDLISLVFVILLIAGFLTAHLVFKKKQNSKWG